MKYEAQYRLFQLEKELDCQLDTLILDIFQQCDDDISLFQKSEI